MRTRLVWAAPTALMFTAGFVAVRYEGPATDLGPSFAEPGVGRERAQEIIEFAARVDARGRTP